MTKYHTLGKILQAAPIFEENFCKKTLLIIFGSPSKPKWIITKGNPENFLHLTGVKINTQNLLHDVSNPNANPLEVFFDKALNRKLSLNDFEIKDHTTEQKINVLLQTLMISKNASMIGDYSPKSGHIKLETDKLAGSVNSCLGFVKTGNHFTPNTVLEADIRNETSYTERVLAILSKPTSKNEIEYSKIEKIAKKIDIGLLLEKIKADVPIAQELLDNNPPQIDEKSKVVISAIDAACQELSEKRAAACADQALEGEYFESFQKLLDSINTPDQRDLAIKILEQETQGSSDKFITELIKDEIDDIENKGLEQAINRVPEQQEQPTQPEAAPKPSISASGTTEPPATTGNVNNFSIINNDGAAAIAAEQPNLLNSFADGIRRLGEKFNAFTDRIAAVPLKALDKIVDTFSKPQRTAKSGAKTAPKTSKVQTTAQKTSAKKTLADSSEHVSQISRNTPQKQAPPKAKADSRESFDDMLKSAAVSAEKYNRNRPDPPNHNHNRNDPKL